MKAARRALDLPSSIFHRNPKATFPAAAGSHFKALHRLEHAGCVSAEWGISENNRRARYYKLTPHGRQQLKAEESAWRRYAAAVFAVLEPAETRRGASASI